MTGDPDIIKIAEKFAPEVVYLRLVELESSLDAAREALREKDETLEWLRMALGGWAAYRESDVYHQNEHRDVLARLDAALAAEPAEGAEPTCGTCGHPKNDHRLAGANQFKYHGPCSWTVATRDGAYPCRCSRFSPAAEEE